MSTVSSSVAKAQSAISTPKVRDLVRQLGEYGLGVCVPHSHDPATGALIELDSETVAVERDLKISFHKRDEVEGEYTPTAWRWNGTAVEVIQNCQLEYPDGPHK